MNRPSRESDHKWDLPLVLPRSRWKSALKQQLGLAILFFRPDVGRRVEAAGETKSFIDELALAGLIARYKANDALHKLAHFHERFWAGEHAVSFHSTHEHRFHNEFLKAHYALVDALESVVAGGNFHTLYEIGCGSGLVIDHLASRFPALRKLVGIDLSAEQIALNKTRFKDPRLQFVAGDAAAWLAANAEPGCIIFTYGGVLEYFTQTMLETLLAKLAAKAPACVAIAEPFDPDFDLNREFLSRAFGGELTYSHNYPRLASNAGFAIRWQEESRSGFRWMLLVGAIEKPSASTRGSTT